ncbi:hypothetical protein [Dyadobacter sp. CY312]|uniref:hypothetical protein n=1 Tax=Dyadobacter sp. CY312 TaxID=2907303 RepID=UPI001F45BCBB|nr:hypothetical protein [Dyadobacter sp. CY312]MCE7038969.1 hypothetical protein [Dyadobacter sp. CY312]
MKTYKAGPELETVLARHGILEFTSKSPGNPYKRKFKTSLSSSKVIRYDHINIEIDQKGHHGTDSRITLTEQDMKALLFFFKANSVDFAFAVPFNKFTFQGVTKAIETLRSRLEMYRELESAKRDVVKLERILRIYDDIEI